MKYNIFETLEQQDHTLSIIIKANLLFSILQIAISHNVRINASVSFIFTILMSVLLPEHVVFEIFLSGFVAEPDSPEGFLEV